MRLFVSYSHKDITKVVEIIGILKNGGHEPWWDRSLLPGDDWKRELQEQIGRCEALVYFASPKANSSDWCQWEIAKANDAEKRFFPILLEGEVIPEALEHLQWADYVFIT